MFGYGKASFVYLMGNASRRVLYTGVTADLYHRAWEHKNNLGGYFTSKYKCDRLVYYETFGDINAAIAREKEVKAWRRDKKNKLVESINPGWKDLAADWYPEKFLKDGVPVNLSKENTRSLGPTRALICPFTPKPGANGGPHNARSLTGIRDDERG